MYELVLNGARVAGAAWAGGVAVTYFNGSLWTYHPLLVSVGWGIASTNAVAFAIRARSLPPKEKEALVERHGQVNVIASTLTLAGSGLMFYLKMADNKPHLQTPHAQLGAAAAGFAVWAIMNGAVSSPLAKDEDLPAWVARYNTLAYGSVEKAKVVLRRIHRVVGATAYVLATAAVVTGLLKKGIHKGASTDALAGTAVLAAVLLLAPGTLNGTYRPTAYLEIVTGAWAALTGRGEKDTK